MNSTASIRMQYDEQLYQKQIGSLKSDLAADSRLELKREAFHCAKNGYYSYIRNDKPLHSMHDPVKEAKRRISELKIERPDQIVIFFGAGLGYSLFFFLQQYENRCLWFENDASLLRATLGFIDFGPALERITAITGIPDQSKLEELLSPFRNKDVLFFVHRPSHAIDPFFETTRKLCENYLNKKDVNIATMARFDRVWTKNLLNNFVHLARAKPVSLFFNRFDDVPAIVCGAGPSLAKSIPELVRYRDRALLIAVDTALRPLAESGVDPDFVVSVDPQPLNRKYLEGYEGNALFVCDPTTSYLTFRLLPENRVFYYKSPFRLSEIFFRHLHVSPGTLSYGGSVSTNAYDLAIQFGCRTILLCGQDLSFTDELAHIRGAVLEENLNLKEARTFRREMHNFRQLHALPTRYLPALSGSNPVKTNDKMVIFFEWFQSRFARDQKNGIQILNCTKNGVRFSIPGADLSLLEERSSVDLHERIHNISGKNEFDASSFLDDIRTVRSKISDLIPVLEQAEAIGKKLYENIVGEGGDSKIADWIRQLESYDARILEDVEISDLISGIIQKSIHLIDQEVDSTDERVQNRVAGMKNYLFYSEMRKGCSLYIRWIDRTIRIFETAYFSRHD